MSPVTRRSLLIGGATVAAVALQPGIAQAHEQDNTTKLVPFTLDATTLDGGEQVTSLTLDVSRFGDIVAGSLTTGTFAVHAKAESPVTLPAGQINFGAYDVDRVVTGVRLHHGKIVIDLKSGFTNSTNPDGSIATNGAPGAGTLGYVYPIGRNLQSKLTYTITQKAPLMTRGNTSLTLPGFTQGKLVNPEVDAYSYRTSSDGMKYRLFSPEGHHGRKPLIVWLHGGGEGGEASLNYYDNESTLRANRGALGFSIDEAQRIFGGAYVVAPQSESYWLAQALPGGPDYAARLVKLVKEVVRKYDIDPSRVYVAGCSNGGYMSLKLTANYHDVFAASVPICGVVRNFPDGAIDITDTELKGITTPSWLVCAKSDTTVPPVNNSEIAAGLIPGVVFTEYDTVTWKGVVYPGHWSWIYVAQNDPKYHGQHVWQWMASKRLSHHN